MFVKRTTEDSMIIGAPAKVNLFLEVLRKREDGYHEINSLFQAVSLFDRLHISRTGQPGVKIELSGGPEVPVGPDNLISRAYQTVRQEVGLDGGIEVRLEKNIPVAAGLGGGSSDAAATILACNLLFDLGLKRSEMAELGLKVGSDLPFFFTGGQALVRGRGEVIEEMALPTDYWLVLVTPPIAISTARAYADLRMDLTNAKTPFNLNRCQTSAELIENIEPSTNDFEEAHLRTFPSLGRIRSALLEEGAEFVRLSGSGPTMFGLYREAPEIIHRDHSLEGDWQIYTVRPITLPMNNQLVSGGSRGNN